MKKLFKVLTVVSLFSIVGLLYGQNYASPEFLDGKEDFEPTVSLTLDWSSKYIYNGVVRNNQPVMMGDLKLGLQGFYIGAWGAYDLTHFQARQGFVRDGDRTRANRDHYKSERKWRFEEVDYYAGFAYTFDDTGDIGPITLDFSWAYFQYPGAHKGNSAEWLLSGSLDELYKTDTQTVSAKLTGSYDYELEQTWISLGALYQLILDNDEMFELLVNGDIFWGDAEYMRSFGADGNGFSYVVLGAAVKVNVCENFSITPYVGASYALDGRVRDWTRDAGKGESAEWGRYHRFNNRQNYWGGIKANVLF